MCQRPSSYSGERSVPTCASLVKLYNEAGQAWAVRVRTCEGDVALSHRCAQPGCVSLGGGNRAAKPELGVIACSGQDQPHGIGEY